MRKFIVTYVAVKSIVMECDDKGLDADGHVLYPEPIDPNGMKDIVLKVEIEGAPMLMSDWVANGDADISVNVHEIS